MFVILDNFTLIETVSQTCQNTTQPCLLFNNKHKGGQTNTKTCYK